MWYPTSWSVICGKSFFYLQVEKFLAEEVYPALKPYEEDSEAELDRVAKLDVWFCVTCCDQH